MLNQALSSWLWYVTRLTTLITIHFVNFDTFCWWKFSGLFCQRIMNTAMFDRLCMIHDRPGGTWSVRKLTDSSKHALTWQMPWLMRCGFESFGKLSGLLDSNSWMPTIATMGGNYWGYFVRTGLTEVSVETKMQVLRLKWVQIFMEIFEGIVLISKGKWCEM